MAIVRGAMLNASELTLNRRKKVDGQLQEPATELEELAWAPSG